MPKFCVPPACDYVRLGLGRRGGGLAERVCVFVCVGVISFDFFRGCACKCVCACVCECQSQVRPLFFFFFFAAHVKNCEWEAKKRKMHVSVCMCVCVCVCVHVSVCVCVCVCVCDRTKELLMPKNVSNLKHSALNWYKCMNTDFKLI